MKIDMKNEIVNGTKIAELIMSDKNYYELRIADKSYMISIEDTGKLIGDDYMGAATAREYYETIGTELYKISLNGQVICKEVIWQGGLSLLSAMKFEGNIVVELGWHYAFKGQEREASVKVELSEDGTVRVVK